MSDPLTKIAAKMKSPDQIIDASVMVHTSGDKGDLYYFLDANDNVIKVDMLDAEEETDGRED